MYKTYEQVYYVNNNKKQYATITQLVVKRWDVIGYYLDDDTTRMYTFDELSLPECAHRVSIQEEDTFMDTYNQSIITFRRRLRIALTLIGVTLCVTLL